MKISLRENLSKINSKEKQKQQSDENTILKNKEMYILLK